MAEGPLLAGFDAGQTHTSCKLAWLKGNGELSPIGQGYGPGVRHLAAPGGEACFREALQQSLRDALQQAGRPDDQPFAAGVGASGIERGSAIQSQGEALAADALHLPKASVAVSGDEHTALIGALDNDPGVLVISGTGCIALGQNGSGRWHRSGGWGWLLDGAGSAMDLGRDGLAISVQMADGRLSETALKDQLWQALGVSTAQELKAAVVAEGFGAAGFARLAPVVDASASSGDPHARVIVERSALALAQMVSSIVTTLELQAPRVCCSGGALTHLKTLREAFAADLAQRCPGATLVEPKGDACDGALRLAVQAALRC